MASWEPASHRILYGAQWSQIHNGYVETREDASPRFVIPSLAIRLPRVLGLMPGREHLPDGIAFHLLLRQWRPIRRLPRPPASAHSLQQHGRCRRAPASGLPVAKAHWVTTRLGPVFDGVAHLVLSPADLAVVAVVTLLAAMRGARSGRRLLALLPPAWLVGGYTGWMFPAGAISDPAARISFLLAGAVVAFTVLVALLAGPLVSIQAFWARIALRVVGSWIAATGVLMIGWTLRTGK